jgi:hypothetical protein
MQLGSCLGFAVKHLLTTERLRRREAEQLGQGIPRPERGNEKRAYLLVSSLFAMAPLIRP